MKYVVLYSGGLDSYITYSWAQRQCQSDLDKCISLYFPLGHRYARPELCAVFQTVPDTEIIHALSGLGSWEEDDGHIWLRNIFLTLAATKVLEKDHGTICLTVQQDERSIPDRSEVAFKGMNALFRTLVSPKENWVVATPWIDHDKTEMVEWYLSEGLSKESLLQTWSCYRPEMINGEAVHCGNCPACIRRYIALVLNKIDCSGHFLEDPKKSKVAEEYRQAAENQKYSYKRCMRIKAAL